MHGDWIVAIASLLAAILGGAAIYFFERLKATRREIQFLVSEPQTITGDLQGHGREFKVMLGDQVTGELNVSVVMKKAVAISFSDRIPQIDPVFNIHLPFFNPKEKFWIKTLVDGAAAASDVSCRLPGTIITFLTQEDIYARYRRRARWQLAFALTAMLILFGILAYFVANADLAHNRDKALLKKMSTDLIEQELKERQLQMPPPLETTK
jgi:hypothetical protein